MHKFTQILFLTFSVSALAGNGWAQSDIGCESTVVVQPGETLSSIAKREYGSVLDYKKIVEATNTQSTLDNSFATIANPNQIKPGWKLCLPGTLQRTLETPSVTTPTASSMQTALSAETTKITFLQINDVYEMTPVGGQGGVARLATLRQELLSANPNTYTILSGDLFSPSALGTAKVDGERLAGKQMVAAMNAFGLDFATLGNHEFDIKEEQFRQRILESETQWFSSNVFEVDGKSFPNIPQNLIFSASNSAGQEVTVGMFGLTLDSNPVSYVSYTDPFEAAAAHIGALKDNVDILVAVTHLPMSQDIELAEKFPELDLIIGGHEHENAIEWAGSSHTPITKADANARTAYIIDMEYDHASDQVRIKPKLKLITADIPDDPEVAQIVENWLDKAFAGFKSQGFDPGKHVSNVTDELDGTEASVRNRSTVLTQLIADGMLIADPSSEISIFNGGSIRIDDTIAPGPITEYDVIRVLPFGGAIISVEMSGSLLAKTLDQGVKSKGIGGYLHTSGVTGNMGAWVVNGTAVQADKTYKVAISDFLITGKEQGFGFLTEEHPELTKKTTHGDIRKAFITQLQKTYGVN